MNRIIKNNQVNIVGKVAGGFLFSHEILGEKFYTAEIKVPRLSGVDDMVPIVVSERLMDSSADYANKLICVDGQFRSLNKIEDGRHRLVLSVFARNMFVLEEREEDTNTNEIFLKGYICKKPVFRKTPLDREIADLLLAVNRPYGKSDYIPCICWGRNAKFAEGLEVGTYIQLQGRIQSRLYQKKLPDNVILQRTAYEVSVSSIEVVENEN